MKHPYLDNHCIISSNHFFNLCQLLTVFYRIEFHSVIHPTWWNSSVLFVLSLLYVRVFHTSQIVSGLFFFFSSFSCFFFFFFLISLFSHLLSKLYLFLVWQAFRNFECPSLWSVLVSSANSNLSFFLNWVKVRHLSELQATGVTSKAFIDNPSQNCLILSFSEGSWWVHHTFVSSAPAHSCIEQYVGIGFEIFYRIQAFWAFCSLNKFWILLFSIPSCNGFLPSRDGRYFF